MANKIITLVYDQIMHVSEKAFFISFGDESVWLPKSQIEIDEKTKTLEIPWWLAVEKEIEDYEY
jgi:hypothetical protein